MDSQDKYEGKRGAKKRREDDGLLPCMVCCTVWVDPGGRIV
jgi:hypothetical protein